jgi:hypothetical protein
VNIEIDEDGKVVAVWFRCITLPFDVTKVDFERAEEMVSMYKTNPPAGLLAVHVEDRK